ncbi:hypothetical protein OG265_08770 [Streptomyces sp. NBC_01208]|uniref:Uncharacterized protein n=1 Tax=Streptomyces glycanivorans TaxID=3033808 RepID=A0ABY9JHD7_9ACTN|nr:MULTISPECIES: hypothetical protein [unclassified Streptomyces]WLQ67155.1 hypothetical protein P8A20_27845 [Streptomyces sp. Alt3]WSR06084.1 hypothetical protein OG265_08770 [Streptomyces sp. NBC_01208]
MGAAIRHFAATRPDGQVFTVNIERDFRYDPYRDFLVCAHCDWSPSLLTARKPADMAGEHLAAAHGAGSGLADRRTGGPADRENGRTGERENDSFRKAPWVVLPLCMVLVVMLLMSL